MRELNNNELNFIAGGNNHDGYNFNFVIRNAITWGFVFGILSPEFSRGFTGGAIIGGGYGLVRMAASALDDVLFEPSPSSSLTI